MKLTMSTVGMVVAGLAAAGVVLALGVLGQDAPASSGDGARVPVAQQQQVPETKSGDATPQAKEIVFPEHAFPKEWNFYPEKPDVQANLRRNVGRVVPPLQVGDFIGEGGAKDLAELRGKPILLDFWGTWCGPCRASIPHINEIAEKHKGALHVLGIHSTRQADQMGETAKKLQMAYPTAADLGNRTSSMLGVQWWPFYVLIDSQGKLRAAGMSSEYVDEAVQRLLDIEAGRWPEK